MLKNRSLIPVRIGRLLQAAGVVQPVALAGALQSARVTNQKVGAVLVESNLIREDVLQAAVEAQKLVRKSAISVELAAQAVQMVHAQGVNLSFALRQLGWRVEDSCHTGDLLSQILLATGAATQVQLDRARWIAQKKDITFGRALILEAVLQPRILVAAFDALVLLRDGKIDVRQAIESLVLVRTTGVSLTDALSIAPHPTARVGELLMASGILSETDILSVLEVALLEQKRIGEVLTKSALVSHLELRAALQLQRMIGERALTIVQAVELLKLVHQQQQPLDVFLDAMLAVKNYAVELLQCAGLLSVEQVLEAESFVSTYGDVARALVARQMVTGELLQSAIRSAIFVQDGRLTPEEALEGVRFCAAGQGSVQEFVEKTGLALLKKLFDQTACSMALSA